MLTRRKRKLRGDLLTWFLEFWSAFDYKQGRAEAADAWLDIPALDAAVAAQIIGAAATEAKNRHRLVALGKTPKMAQGWLSGRRWEDEHLGVVFEQPSLEQANHAAVDSWLDESQVVEGEAIRDA